MPNQFGVPEISVHEVSVKRQEGGSFTLVDVREAMELRLANLGEDVIWLPLSKLAEQRLASIPTELNEKDAEIVIFCHTGVRSAQVAAWLRQQGWTNVWSMAGGIDAYARDIDRTVGFY